MFETIKGLIYLCFFIEIIVDISKNALFSILKLLSLHPLGIALLFCKKTCQFIKLHVLEDVGFFLFFL